jgi:hypothetical protein
LIKKSKRHYPFLEQVWDAATFEDIDWKAVRSSFGRLTKGRQFQLSKYAHNWTRHYISEPPKTTALTNTALPAALGGKILITSYAAQVTDEYQHEIKQKLNSLATGPSIILPHQWPKLSWQR